jgi:predicted nuclease of restriction endonuclease-like (RecB) superfamily
MVVLAQKAKGRDLEQALLNDVQSFLMEMGRGFALVGRRFPLGIVDEQSGREDEFFIDLLFNGYLLRPSSLVPLLVLTTSNYQLH